MPYFGLQYLTEETIVRSDTLNVQINATANTNFKYDPYIKVYVGPVKKTDEVSRIYLKDATYVKDHKGKKCVELSSSQLKELNDLMHKKDDNGVTNYQKALDYTVSRCNLEKDFYKDFKIQDFTKVDYRKDKSGKDKK